MKVDVVIMAALREERDALLRTLDRLSSGKRGKSHPPRQYCTNDKSRTYEIRIITVKDNNDTEAKITIAVPNITEVGPLKAAAATSRLLQDISPRLTILVGIAGCMHPNAGAAKLGDVAVATQVYDIGNYKIRPNERNPNWTGSKCDAKLLPLIMGWTPSPKWKDRILAKKPAEHPSDVNVHFGSFLSGSWLIADEATKLELADQTPSRNLCAIEMEAAGIVSILEQDHEHASFLVIKSFTDFGDADSTSTRDEWKLFASAAAAEYTATLLVECIGKCVKGLRTQQSNERAFEQSAYGALKCFTESFAFAKPYFTDTATRVFDEAIEEVIGLGKIAAPNDTAGEAKGMTRIFRAKLGAGRQFLTRAEGIFGHASKIVAFSLDSVSTFWASPKMRVEVKKYIDHQGTKQFLEKAAGLPRENVFRLFVFTTPERAHDYARRLDYHSRKFPNTFVCSLDHYRELLRTRVVSRPEYTQRWTTRDYGLLTYEGQHGISASYFATFEDEDFTIRPIDEGSEEIEGVRIARATELLQTMAQDCGPARVSDIYGVPILKWVPGFWETKKGRQQWAKALGELFTEEHADVFHATGFKIARHEDYTVFRQALAELKNDLNRGTASGSLNRFGIRNIRLTRRLDYKKHPPHPIDETTKGKLFYPEKELPSDVIVMRVADREKLHGFLSHPDHLRLRLKLFMTLAKTNPKLKRLLERHSIKDIQDLIKLKNKDRIYSSLENAAQLWRVDLSDHQLVHELVSSEPQPFS